MNIVSIEHCESYEYQEVREKLVALLEPLGGITAFVKPGERVLLKPNMLAAKIPEQAVTTHPTIVQVVAEMVRGAGGQVLIGDSPGIGKYSTVTERTGIRRAAEESGAELLSFDETIEIQGDGTFRSIAIARAYWEADKVINLPKLKTHEMMTMTCAVKNLFGVVVGAEKPGWHLKAGSSRELFARLLLEIYLLKKPSLNIVDAVVAMEGDGPGSGDPLQLGMLLAGVNPVAVDLVAGRVARIPAEMLYVEQEAVKMGLEGALWKDVDLVGSKPEDFQRRPFRLPKGLDVQFGLPNFLKQGLRNYLMAHPYAAKEACVLCGICRDACPPEAITIKNSALSVDYGRCIHCWCCRELCPHDAMEVRKGLLLKVATKLSRVKRR